MKLIGTSIRMRSPQVIAEDLAFALEARSVEPRGIGATLVIAWYQTAMAVLSLDIWSDSKLHAEQLQTPPIPKCSSCTSGTGEWHSSSEDQDPQDSLRQSR